MLGLFVRSNYSPCMAVWCPLCVVSVDADRLSVNVLRSLLVNVYIV